MSGFEIIVRPVVFPNIRPQAARSLPPEDDPEKGKATIRGNPAKVFSLSYSYSFSASSSNEEETERQFDEVRVYQKRDDGTINRKNFVDLEVSNKISIKGAKVAGFEIGKEPTRAQQIEAQRRYERNIEQAAEEAKNIEIRKWNERRKAQEVGE